MATKCYDVNPKKQCFYKLRLKVIHYYEKEIIGTNMGGRE